MIISVFENKGSFTSSLSEEPQPGAMFALDSGDDAVHLIELLEDCAGSMTAVAAAIGEALDKLE